MSEKNNKILEDQSELETIKNELVFEGVQPAKADGLAKRIFTQAMTFHQGPLPSVSDFKGYDEICPGAARDILDMSKYALAHRVKIETTTLHGDIFLHSIGVLATILIIGGVLFTAVYLAVNGHDWVAGIALSGADIVGIIEALLKNKNKQN